MWEFRVSLFLKNVPHSLFLQPLSSSLFPISWFFEVHGRRSFSARRRQGKRLLKERTNFTKLLPSLSFKNWNLTLGSQETGESFSPTHDSFLFTLLLYQNRAVSFQDQSKRILNRMILLWVFFSRPPNFLLPLAYRYVAICSDLFLFLFSCSSQLRLYSM